VQIRFDVLQEVEIVLPLEEDRLTVIAAVVEVIILFGEERCFAAGHDRSETSEVSKNSEVWVWSSKGCRPFLVTPLHLLYQ